MKNTLRCCISCILPCGALDVIRIVHCNGRVEEISGSVKAGEIMKAYPKHVLKKPSSPSGEDAVVPKIVIVPPDAELQRGKIYFLMPVPSTPATEKTRQRSSTSSSSSSKKKMKEQSGRTKQSERASSRSNSLRSNSSNSSNAISMAANLLVSSDRYLTDILSEKLSTQRDRRRGRVAVWRPHLESISESPSDL
ncbi:hypothetical protein L6164_017459 [Bauhinia variegata]|uniref:Uncharacterized protein n=1 Tax=Bauhinia variegata TaxID=167791 RepID=A0ACB9N7V0_BAUVA|nr:hypothetical protein L6164_017459 [Bauhinia variegata]